AFSRSASTAISSGSASATAAFPIAGCSSNWCATASIRTAISATSIGSARTNNPFSIADFGIVFSDQTQGGQRHGTQVQYHQCGERPVQVRLLLQFGKDF